jgi:hypothetical protein
VPKRGSVTLPPCDTGRTVADLVAHVGDVCDIPATEPTELLAALDGEQRRLVLAVDAVDEASQPRELCWLLNDLVDHGCRALVACRPHLTGQLGDPQPMRLDEPAQLDRDGVKQLRRRAADPSAWRRRDRRSDPRQPRGCAGPGGVRRRVRQLPDRPTRGARPRAIADTGSMVLMMRALHLLDRDQLRHAHAVEMARDGVSLILIQRQLGHTNPGDHLARVGARRGVGVTAGPFPRPALRTGRARSRASGSPQGVRWPLVTLGQATEMSGRVVARPVAVSVHGEGIVWPR